MRPYKSYNVFYDCLNTLKKENRRASLYFYLYKYFPCSAIFEYRLINHILKASLFARKIIEILNWYGIGQNIVSINKTVKTLVMTETGFGSYKSEQIKYVKLLGIIIHSNDINFREDFVDVLSDRDDNSLKRFLRPNRGAGASPDEIISRKFPLCDLQNIFKHLNFDWNTLFNIAKEKNEMRWHLGNFYTNFGTHFKLYNSEAELLWKHLPIKNKIKFLFRKRSSIGLLNVLKVIVRIEHPTITFSSEIVKSSTSSSWSADFSMEFFPGSFEVSLEDFD